MAPAASAAPPVVYTVNYPLQYFADRIAGDLARVVFPAPADVDPAHWQPGIDAIRGYQQADLVLLNGAGYARWIAQASLRRGRLVDTSAGFREHLIGTDTVKHSHGPGGEHVHGGYAPHTWLDPVQAQHQAAAVHEALRRLLPEAKETLARNHAHLHADLQALDDGLRAALADGADAPVLTAGADYVYLGRRYGLRLVDLHWQADTHPSRAAWEVLAQLAAETGAASLWWPTEPLAATRRELESHGIRSVVFETAANRPGEGDYLAVMRANLERLATVAD